MPLAQMWWSVLVAAAHARFFFAPSYPTERLDLAQVGYTADFVSSTLPQQQVVAFVPVPRGAASSFNGGVMAAGVAIAAAAAGVLAGRRATLAIGGGQRPVARSFGREKGGLETAEETEMRYNEWRSSMGVTVEPADQVEDDDDDDDVSALDPSKIKVTLSTKHFDITPAIREHVDERLTHVAERFGDHILALDSHLEVLRNPRGKDEKHSAELVAAVRPGYGKKCVIVRVKATSHDMYLAINDMTHQMERKVRQMKEKVTKNIKHAKRSDEGSLLSELPGYDGPVPSDLDEAVRDAQTSAPMTMDEALETFNIAADGGGEDILVFVDDMTQEVSVLYRDDDRHVNLYVPKERSVTQIC
jgi:ribosomal subunit interface protein